MRTRLERLTDDAQHQLRLVAQWEQQAGEYRIKAGASLLLLRQWVEAGEAGSSVAWWEYYSKHFDRSRRHAERLMRIASDENPEGAAELAREYDRQQAAAYRLRKAQADAARIVADQPTKPDNRVIPMSVTTDVSRTQEPFAEPVRLSYNPAEHALQLVRHMTREQRLDCIVEIVREMASEEQREVLSRISDEVSAFVPRVVRQIRH